MSDRTKVSIAKYGITCGLAFVLIWVYCSSRNLFLQSEMERWRILCDAFTIPGLTYVMIGFLMMIANEGFFDMLGYACGKAMDLFIPGRKYDGEKYYEYVQRKRENRSKGYGFLFVVGGILMALAVVFLMLFYRLYNA